MVKFDENGFTGLEAAIVLIAFVVVAAVFSYVVLGAGFYTTQSAQAAVHTSIDQASSSLEIVGNVMGVSNTDHLGSQISFVNVSVALTAGGTPMDISQMVVSYTDSAGGRNPNVKNTSDLSCLTLASGGLDTSQTDVDSIEWCVAQRLNDLGTYNNLLEPNEIWIISVQTPDSAGTNQQIGINMQPAVGAYLPVTRTIPGAINKIQALH
jgi:archaeal flagellin FlaB